jgi:hypothetical protein
MTRDELIQQLRDISPPIEPAWWLPAPGHLALLLLALLLVAAICYWRARRRSGLLLEQARRELHRIATQQAKDVDACIQAQALARWLKRVALLAYPQRRLESLTGRAWLEFLDQPLGGENFTRGTGRIFGGDVYRREVEADTQALLDLCERWLEAVSPRLLHRGRR